MKFVRTLEVPFGAMRHSARLPDDASAVGMLFSGTSTRDFRLRVVYETSSRLNGCDHEVILVTDYSPVTEQAQYVGSFVQENLVRHVYLRKTG